MDLYFTQSHVVLEDTPWKLSQYLAGFPTFAFFEFSDRYQQTELIDEENADDIIYRVNLKADLNSSRVYKR